MRTHRLATSLLALFVGSLPTVAQQGIEPRMGYASARRMLLRSLNNTYPCPQAGAQPLQSVAVTPTLFGFTGTVNREGKFKQGNFELTYSTIYGVRDFEYSHGQEPEKWCGPDARYGATLYVEHDKHYYLFIWRSGENADSFVKALKWLVANAGNLSEEAIVAEFKRQAGDWQALPVKPPMPESAREHKVLAENAFQEKNLGKAIDEYENALQIFPTWPEGQFNVALICGETGDYDCAVEHMQDYLELVPDAADAQTAKDKIIIWKDKLGQMQSSQPTSPVATKQRK